MATTVYKFSKSFRGSMPPDPLKPILFFTRFKIILPEKKNTLENMANLDAPSLKKLLEYVADMKTFSKGFLRLLGAYRLCI